MSNAFIIQRQTLKRKSQLVALATSDINWEF